MKERSSRTSTGSDTILISFGVASRQVAASYGGSRLRFDTDSAELSGSVMFSGISNSFRRNLHQLRVPVALLWRFLRSGVWNAAGEQDLRQRRVPRGL